MLRMNSMTASFAIARLQLLRSRRLQYIENTINLHNSQTLIHHQMNRPHRHEYSKTCCQCNRHQLQWHIYTSPQCRMKQPLHRNINDHSLQSLVKIEERLKVVKPPNKRRSIYLLYILLYVYISSQYRLYPKFSLVYPISYFVNNLINIYWCRFLCLYYHLYNNVISVWIFIIIDCCPKCIRA